MSPALRPPSIKKAKFPLWTAVPLTFRDPVKRDFKTYPKYTKCEKVVYTSMIEGYLDSFEDRHADACRGGRAVAIKLDGRVRYLWRYEVLTEAEYNEVQKKQRSKLDLLRKKRVRVVGKE